MWKIIHPFEQFVSKKIEGQVSPPLLGCSACHRRLLILILGLGGGQLGLLFFSLWGILSRSVDGLGVLALEAIGLCTLTDVAQRPNE